MFQVYEVYACSTYNVQYVHTLRLIITVFVFIS